MHEEHESDEMNARIKVETDLGINMGADIAYRDVVDKPNKLLFIKTMKM